MLVDTHAHIDTPSLRKISYCSQAKQAGLERLITIGINLELGRKAIRLAERLFLSPLEAHRRVSGQRLRLRADRPQQRQGKLPAKL